MTIDTDPKIDNSDDSDDGFNDAFAEFAAGKAPNSEEDQKAAAPEGNGPEGEAAAPDKEDDKSTEPAADKDKAPDAATSGEADADGGGQPPAADDTKAPDDIWASLSQEQKDALSALQRERDEAIHRASSDANRVAALSRKLREVSAGQTSVAPPATQAQPTEAQKALDAKITQLKKDYGEIADPLIELIEAQRQELSQVRANLHGLNEHQQQAVIESETRVLEAMHPDWAAIAQSPDFAGWLQVQPRNIQSLASSWDARETSVVLTLFKAERAEATGQTQATTQQPAKPDAATEDKRSQQLEGSRDVRSKPAPAASGPPEDFDAAFAHFVEKRQRAAQR